MNRSLFVAGLGLAFLLSPRAAFTQSSPAEATKPVGESKTAAPNNPAPPSKAEPSQPEQSKPEQSKVEEAAARFADLAFADLDGDREMDLHVVSGQGVLLSGAKEGHFEVVVVAHHTMGAALSPASDALRAQLKIASGQGLVVTQVTADSLAAKAGLQVDDVLLLAGDRPLAKPADVSDIVNSPVKRPFTVEFTLLRGGERRKVPLAVSEAPRERGLAEIRLALSATEEPAFRIGVEVSDAGSTLRSQLKLPKGQGIVIDRALPDAPAQKAGLQQHDVLVTVAGKPLHKSEDLSAAVQASAGKPLKFSILRGGQRVDISVTPEKRSSDREGLYRWFRSARAETGLRVIEADNLSNTYMARPQPQSADSSAVQIERMLKQIDELRASVKALQGTVAKEQKPSSGGVRVPRTDLPKTETPKQ